MTRSNHMFERDMRYPRDAQRIRRSTNCFQEDNEDNSFFLQLRAYATTPNMKRLKGRDRDSSEYD